MADTTMTGATKEVEINSDAVVSSKKKIIKWVIILVLIAAGVWVVKKYIL